MHFCFSEDGPASPDQCWMTASLQIRHSRLLATFSVSPAGRLPSTEGSSRLVRWHNPGIHGCSSATVNWCFRALAAACVMIEPGLNLLWAYRLELRCFLMCFCTRPSSSGPAQQQCLRRCRVTGIFCWLLTMHQSPVRGVAWAISAHILGPGIQFCCVHAGHACSYFPDTSLLSLLCRAQRPPPHSSFSDSDYQIFLLVRCPVLRDSASFLLRRWSSWCISRVNTLHLNLRILAPLL